MMSKTAQVRAGVQSTPEVEMSPPLPRGLDRGCSRPAWIPLVRTRLMRELPSLRLRWPRRVWRRGSAARGGVALHGSRAPGMFRQRRGRQGWLSNPKKMPLAGISSGGSLEYFALSSVRVLSGQAFSWRSTQRTGHAIVRKRICPAVSSKSAKRWFSNVRH